MNKSSTLALATLVALIGVGLFVFTRPEPEAVNLGSPTTIAPTTSEDKASLDLETPASTPPEMTVERPISPSDAKVAPKPKSPYARITIKAGDPIPVLTPFQDERDALMNLAATQDAGKIPTIAESLRHEDATVREAARQALLQLGKTEAIPFLKEAASTNRNREETDLLREAADFLALPRFPDVILSANPPETPPFPTE